MPDIFGFISGADQFNYIAILNTLYLFPVLVSSPCGALSLWHNKKNINAIKNSICTEKHLFKAIVFNLMSLEIILHTIF